MNEKMIAVLDKMADYMDDVFGENTFLLNCGPGHIVFDDYNLDDNSIELCLEATDNLLTDAKERASLPVLEKFDDKVRLDILLTTRQFLVDLLDIPEDERYVYEEEDFQPPKQPEWRRIGRAVEVNIDRLSDDNLVVVYFVFGETVGDKVEVRALQPQRLYENVTLTSLARLATFMENADNELLEGQASQIRDYLLERTSRLN